MISNSENLPSQHRLSVLIPVYNSEATLPHLIDDVVNVLWNDHRLLHEIILVNDGSRDGSHEKILSLIDTYGQYIRYIRLYRNFGEHNAVMCGLNFVTGDSVAIIDDDFQNPPSEIVVLQQKLMMGYDVVYSFYEDKKHSLFRNLGSYFNDRVATLLLNKPTSLYLSSFKIIDSKLVKFLIQYEGPYPYIDGLILRSTRNIGTQKVKHQSRDEGKSGYTLGKLISLWLNMFTGFSIVPLRIATYSGTITAILSLILGAYFITSRLAGFSLINQDVPPGWASLVVLMTFLSGLQLMMLGMIGEYLGRLFMFSNGHPQFLIRDTYGINSIEEE